MDGNFVPALRTHLESLPHLGMWEQRTLRIAQNPNKKRNARILKRLEAGTREKVGLDPSSIIDWFKQNWTSILQVVISLIPLLLMFLGPEPGDPLEADEMQGWWLGKNILLDMLPMLLDKVGLPTIREMANDSPVPVNYDDATLKAYIMAKVEAAQAKNLIAA